MLVSQLFLIPRLLPYLKEQVVTLLDGLDDIGVCVRVHRREEAHKLVT